MGRRAKRGKSGLSSYHHSPSQMVLLRMSATERSYTQNFFKLQYIIIQAILSRKSMKKSTVTDEKIFRVYKAFDRKK